MKKDQPSIEILKEMLVEFKEYKSDLLRTKKKNEDAIEQIDRYLNSLFKNEEFNYKVFSPRNVESIYKEEIEEQNYKKSMIEKDSHSFIKKISFFSDKIEKLEMVIKSEEEREEDLENSESKVDLSRGIDIHSEEGLGSKECIDSEAGIDSKIDTGSIADIDGKEEIENKAETESKVDVGIKVEKDNKGDIEKKDELETETTEQSLMGLNLQELERQRIARDLHDTTVQNLVHLIHKIELCSKYMDQDVIRARLEIATITKEIKNVINDMRGIIFNLRSMTFDDIGCEATIHNLFEDLQNKTDLTITYTFEDISLYNSITQISILRIVQECCMNSIKHSEGQNIDVVVKNDSDSLIVVVKDDGKGFKNNVEEFNALRHFGLAMIRERVQILSGILKINTNKGNGTEIVVEIPRRNKKVH